MKEGDRQNEFFSGIWAPISLAISQSRRPPRVCGSRTRGQTDRNRSV